MATTTVTLDWLGLATPDVSELVAYYESTFGLEAIDDPPCPEATVGFSLGDGWLVTRPYTTLPSGGVHTHFAISITESAYDQLYESLDTPVERTFGGQRSLYHFDPAGHCVEFGERPALDSAVGPIFEVVLEVASLDIAIERYRQLGFEPLDRGSDRPRCRLRGPFDLELWEPHLGIADARGGCHVDLGITVEDANAAAAVLGQSELPEIDNRLFVRDPDGHTWWVADA